MAQPFETLLLAFNRGLVSPLAIAREDIKRLALSADTMANWVPRVLGSMMLRPALQFKSTTLTNQVSNNLEFIFGTNDVAAIELTPLGCRVRVNDVVVTRPLITSTTFNDWDGVSAYQAGVQTSSLFATLGDVNLWHSTDDAGAVSGFDAAGGLSLVGTGTASARRNRSLNVQGVDVGKEHELTIVVDRGNAFIVIGTSEGDDSYLTERQLRPGTHSIAITPSATFFVQLYASDMSETRITSVTLTRAAHDMVIPTPWNTANLDDIRYTQSGDVMFVACKSLAPMRIERQDRTNTPPSRSWSVVKYVVNDGPFGALNTGPITLSPGALTGDTTLTASAKFFKATHIGGLFRVASSGQDVKVNVLAQNTFSNFIRVTGVGSTGRSFTLTLSGPTFTGTTTVTLQRSVGSPGTWVDVSTYTGVGTVSIYDNLDNQIIYYRVGVKTGQFTGGDNINLELVFAAGSISGVCRVTSITSPTVAQVAILSPMGQSAQASQNWYEGDWSPKNGFPSAVELYDGRMIWAGKAIVWGSVSNLFDSMNDDTTLGDSAMLRKQVGSGPVDNIPWLLGLNYLVVGAEGTAQVAKANAIDDPLTPTAFTLKVASTNGSAPMRAVKVDTNGIFVGRNGSRVFELSADANLYTTTPYSPADLTALVPELGLPAFKRVAVQRNPETRVHLVRSDGTVVLLVFDKLEKVVCFCLVQTPGAGGVVEDAYVLPSPSTVPGQALEDQVYYVVRRTVNGATVRYVEKWATELQAIGATDTRIADSAVTVTGPGGPVVGGFSHLVGQSVVVWADGVCPMDASDNPKLYLVNGAGQITLDNAFTTVMTAGLPYTAQWRNAKMAVGDRMAAPLNVLRGIDHVGFVMANVHARGLKFGGDFDPNFMDGMPSTEDGDAVDRNKIWSAYDKIRHPLDGAWDTDPRVCLQAQAPLPCTMMAISVSGQGK